MIFGDGLLGGTTDVDGATNAIGYFAYPNPRFKNQIPDVLFFGYERLARSSDSLPVPSGSFSVRGKLEQSVTRSAYFKKIQRIRQLLRDGDVYQINYAIRFRQRFSGDPYALFFRLAKANPAAFSAYLDCGDFQIVSCSPERLFQVKNGVIMTQPVKGTIQKPEGATPSSFDSSTSSELRTLPLRKGEKNERLQVLLSSEKERAELDMITDLERNDIGRICEYGSVRVIKERDVMELPNLWHTYSEIEGRLRQGIRPGEIFQAIFPGGSITGCPKIRAMEYIEKLERMPRNIFTGSIGYIVGGRPPLYPPLIKGGKEKGGIADTMDFNIAIRTILIQDGWLEFWAGGGIVWDSDPEGEYQECMLKAERIVGTIGNG